MGEVGLSVSKRGRSLTLAHPKTFPAQPLPTDYDAMASNMALINRAIAMHLLREGQFSVASTFIQESQSDNMLPLPGEEKLHDGKAEDDDADTAMQTSAVLTAPGGADKDSHAAGPSLQSNKLQAQFAKMYSILSELRNRRNLLPAIEWAAAHSAELEARGSNLEFELERLQFVWLFKGSPTADDEADDSDSQSMHPASVDGDVTMSTSTTLEPSEHGHHDNSHSSSHHPDVSSSSASSASDLGARTNAALAYARQHFGRFQGRHLRDIQRLVAALVFAGNLSASPYASAFDTTAAFSDAAVSFTRDFCSLLGLSAESPLYVAATAGAIALPRANKWFAATKDRRTEWTTLYELPFETPLPRSMIYHPIFVCPVSKEQTTAANPPVMLPCGHVIARESLNRLTKTHRFKCPYCPLEGHVKDVREIILSG